MQIVHHPDGHLSLKTDHIFDIDAEIRQSAKEMIDTMYGYSGVGLAANQVGLNLRMFVYDAGEGPSTIINPVITQRSGFCFGEEGCLSIPDKILTVKRATCITLIGRNLQNKIVKHQANGLLARIFQHEMDHLLGMTILDRV